MSTVPHPFTRFSKAVARWTGKPATFIAAVALVVVWAVTGPLFDFSETWQLVINTGTTIITFLMVFVLQNAQTRDTAAIQAKLDELILSSSKAEDRFIGIENLDDEELKHLEQKIVAAATERGHTPAGEGRAERDPHTKPRRVSPAVRKRSR